MGQGAPLIPVNHVAQRVSIAAAILSNCISVLHWLSLHSDSECAKGLSVEFVHSNVSADCSIRLDRLWTGWRRMRTRLRAPVRQTIARHARASPA